MEKAIKPLKILYTGTMLVLALGALLIVILEYTVALTPEQHLWLSRAGKAIVTVFAVEFLAGLMLAKDKKTYFKDNWLSLLAILSSMKFLKSFKALKSIKATTALKGAKAGKLADKFISLMTKAKHTSMERKE